MLDPDDRIMLVRFEFPTVTVWATPGGGQEPGEDDEATVRRELDEELGLPSTRSARTSGPGRTSSRSSTGAWDGQRDHVYLVRTPSFTPAPALTWDQLRAERLHELRWWTRRRAADVPAA